MEMSVPTGIESSEPLRTWAGHGTGVICNGCGERIQAHEIEYEVEMPAGSTAATLNFHLGCYRSWAASNGR